MTETLAIINAKSSKHLSMEEAIANAAALSGNELAPLVKVLSQDKALYDAYSRPGLLTVKHDFAAAMEIVQKDTLPP